MDLMDYWLNLVIICALVGFLRLVFKGSDFNVVHYLQHGMDYYRWYQDRETFDQFQRREYDASVRRALTPEEEIEEERIWDTEETEEERLWHERTFGEE